MKSLFIEDFETVFTKAHPNASEAPQQDGHVFGISVFELSGEGDFEKLKVLAREVYEKMKTPEDTELVFDLSEIPANRDEIDENIVFFGKTSPECEISHAIGDYEYDIRPEKLYMLVGVNDDWFLEKKLEVENWVLTNWGGENDFWYVFPTLDALTEYGAEIRNAIERLGYTVRLAMTNSESDNARESIYR